MIPVFGSEVGEDELREVAACMEAQWLGMGPRSEAFEERLRARLGLESFLFLNSGSNALHLAVGLLDLPRGSEVIVPTFTWVSCAQAVVLAGHRPVFCDVDLPTQNVTAETIACRLTPRTAAVMVVHYAGKPVDMDPILELGLPVIEDAAHAVDSRYRGRPCGGIGDVGIYSFDAVKNLTTGSGGGITMRDPSLLERARKLRYCGIGRSGFQALRSGEGPERWWEYDISDAFFKALPSDLNAAIGLAQLGRLDALQARRRAIWNAYQEAFAGVDWIGTPADAGDDEQHSYFTYFVQVPHRDELAHLLRDKRIYTTLRFHPLHLNAIYGETEPLPNAERLNQVGLNLPLHPRLSDEDVQHIVASVLGSRPRRSATGGGGST